MKKDIKDFLHLYLRSGIRYFVFPDDSITDGFLQKYKEQYPHGEYAPIMDSYESYQRVLKDGYKPILRPLSDMTEEEAFELVKFDSAPHRHVSIDIFEIKDNSIWYADGEMWHGDGVSEMYDKYIKFNELSPEQYRYLLSKGFDLFQLIEAGLAIDATTLKQEA